MSNTTDLIARLRTCRKDGLAAATLWSEAADALEAMSERLAFHVAFTRDAQNLCQAAQKQVEAQAREIEALRSALRKVLDTRSKEAKAAESYRNVAENCSDSSYACKAHERAMFAAIDAEREARKLLNDGE